MGGVRRGRCRLRRVAVEAVVEEKRRLADAALAEQTQDGGVALRTGRWRRVQPSGPVVAVTVVLAAATAEPSATRGSEGNRG